MCCIHGPMDGAERSLPAVEEFTDYSQWERRPSNKSGICSVCRGRAGGGKHEQAQRHTTLLLAARLSHDSVLVDHAPEHCCHSSTKKYSSYSPPPRLTRHSTNTPRKKVSKVPSAVSDKHTLLEVGPSTIGSTNSYCIYVWLLQIQLELRRQSIRDFTKYRADLYPHRTYVYQHTLTSENPFTVNAEWQLTYT